MSDQAGNLGHWHTRGILGEQFDLVAGLHIAFGSDAQVVATAARGQESPHHPGIVEADAQLVTREPRLGDHKLGGADPQPVADEHLVLERYALDGEVLSEHPPRKVPADLPLPIRIVLGRVDVHRLVGASVDGQIGLAVPVEIDPGHLDATFNGPFEDSG